MKTFNDIKTILQQHKKFIRDKYGVREIGVFGSYIRGEQVEDSDVDILVEFEKPVGFFRFLELEEYLESILSLKVDLVTKKALKPTIGKYILDELVNV
ncbi:MAG: nucleotidyltransferase family protein [Nitrospirae bacterium]|nr:nucleotidyltransferase family protein [Nitrospirota bacterium]